MTIKIYVGNLPYTVKESQLSDLFTPFGKVESAKIVTDRYSGNSRGFAFIEMANRNEGQQAIKEVNGHEIKGRRIKVSESRTRRDKWGYQSRRSGGSRG